MTFSLSKFERPSRYIGNEVNSVRKDAPVRIAFAFPDTYEVGMSHLGLKILARIANQLPFASAERAFHPWTDMEAYLKHKKEPLRSLESGTPLGLFDVVGFSLQYELSFSSVLNMLTLAGMPLFSEERLKDSYPLVIAGGPSAVNPAPLAPFIDAFLIGDGEEAITELAETVYRWKTGGGVSEGKEALLKAVSEIPGFYVPQVHKGGSRVARRIIQSLEDAPYPENPVLPYMPIVHDRVNIEISRGCPMGCRFCQAGMIYRPLRERSPRRILELAKKSLAATGYDEVSFTSLSAGDYSALLPLIREFNHTFSPGTCAVSLPSLRVKALNQEVLREIKSVRKTGFTIAPEAGTDRLRAVINKDLTEEDFDRAVGMLFKEGWLTIKLYFMIGLPTETGEDVEAIPRMARKALKTAAGYSRRASVNVGVSTFVPKPHTPFQWCGQEPIAEITRKKDFLRKALSGRGLNFKGHDERMSLLEAAFARGDESLSGLLLEAHKAGARLDGWSEVFDWGKWVTAMDRSGVDAAAYAARVFSPEDELPWAVIDPGVSDAFLKREYEAALAGRKTPGCIQNCSGCGLSRECGLLKNAPGQVEAEAASSSGPVSNLKSEVSNTIRIRFQFSKTSPLADLSHREIISAISRAARRAGLPVEYSKGFHPAPKLALGPPLGVGVKGLKECFDMVFDGNVSPEGAMSLLNAQLPPGLSISRAVHIGRQDDSLQSFISVYDYEIIGIVPEKAAEFLARDSSFAERDNGKKIDIRKMVEGCEKTGADSVLLRVTDTEEAKPRLDELVKEIFGAELCDVDATRVGMYGRSASELKEPLK
ncbi:MAG: TIGR03960 family B12-binding radical SAM protein [Nitrospiraceae bacterium]|nr:TIGR03960 family B12-binding radical SAM protein [Nitrospiraceae bacterium]